MLDRDPQAIADYQRRSLALRAADIPSELYLGESGLNAQLKYADKRGSHSCAVIQGSNERDAPGGRQVVIRDLTLGAELAEASKHRADYLELRQRAPGERARGRACGWGSRGAGAVTRSRARCPRSPSRDGSALARLIPVFSRLREKVAGEAGRMRVYPAISPALASFAKISSSRAVAASVGSVLTPGEFERQFLARAGPVDQRDQRPHGSVLDPDCVLAERGAARFRRLRPEGGRAR